MIAPDVVRATLARRCLVLDGGLATELEARGKDLDDPLWSARVLLEDEATLAEVHGAFVDAGADVVATASYQASREGLAVRGLDAAAADALIQRSVRVARDAITRRGARTWVAASMGSYGATRHDGSEYTGRWELDDAGLTEFHRTRTATLVAADPDLLAFETIPSLAEVSAITAALDGFPDQSAWVSLSLRDETHAGAGEPLQELATALSACPSVIAIGVNCCPPSWIAPALRRLASATDRALVAYPNSGERWNASLHRWEGDPEADHPPLAEWLDAGARMIGGCCRTRPARIATLAAELRAI